MLREGRMSVVGLNYQTTERQRMERKKRYEQQEFLFGFFESFHDSHERLSEMSEVLSREQLFEDHYLSQVLQTGLPKYFDTSSAETEMSDLFNLNRRRSSTQVSARQFHLHLELQMLTNLKSFFNEREIDISDLIETIKEEKRTSGRRTGMTENSENAYWHLAKLIFTAFYLDHTQNEYLMIYFDKTLPSQIQNFKLALEIIQVQLDKADIQSKCPTEEDLSFVKQNSLNLSIRRDSLNASIENGEADSVNWDPFLDAEKFEQLAMKKQNRQKKLIQQQLAMVKQADNVERKQKEIQSQENSLQESIHLTENKLAQRTSQLRAKEEHATKLAEEKEQLEADLNEKNEAIRILEQRMHEQERNLRKERINAEHSMIMLDKLQDVVKKNQKLEEDVNQKASHIRKLELEKQRLKIEARIGLKSMRDLSMGDDMNLNFRSFDDEDESITRIELKGKNGKAISENVQNYQKGYLGSAKTAIQTGENTELDRISSSELEHITGSFANEEIGQKPEEEEFVDQYNESFTSQKSRLSINSNLMTRIVELADPSKQEDEEFEKDFLNNITSCFHLEGGMLLLAFGDFVIIMNDQMETVSVTNFRKLFGPDFQGHAVSFRSDSSADGNCILIGFNYAEVPEQMASSNIFEGQSCDYDSWIARFVYDAGQKQLKLAENIEDSVLIRGEEIRSFVEYEGRYLLVSTESNSILQFQDWQLKRIYLDMNLQSPEFTRGYLSPQPTADEETTPFHPVADSQEIEQQILFTLKDDFLQQLTQSESEKLRQKQNFMIKRDQDGISLSFSSPVKLKNGTTQINLVQMKFNADFDQTLQSLTRSRTASVNSVESDQMSRSDTMDMLAHQRERQVHLRNIDTLQLLNKQQSIEINHLKRLDQNQQAAACCKCQIF